MKILHSGWIFLALYALSIVDTSTAQTGVCYTSVLSSISTTGYYSSSFTSSYSCGFLWLSRCSRTHYRTSSQIQYTSSYRRVFRCCPGYHQVGSSTCQKIGSVRLVGGVSSYEGRVEIFLNGQWGTVCDNFWDVNDASVVCRQLGYNNSHLTPQAFSRAEFGQGTGAIHLDNVHCIGNETLLTSCTYPTGHDCGHHEDAGVRCRQCPETGIRLRGWSSPLEGRVEVCLGGGWGTVCDDGWDTADATVACRQLAFNTNGATAFSRARFGQGIGLPIAMDNLLCTSSETHLVNCSYLGADAVRSCSHREDAGVRCLPLPPRTAPSRVTVTALSSTSLRVSWVSPVAGDWNGQMTGFKITIRNIDSSTSSTIAVSNSATSHRISSLHPYYRYECRVAAYNSRGNGPFSSPVTRRLPQDRPSGYPRNVISMTHSSRSFSLSWSPPLPEERNGIIMRYAVLITDSSASQIYLTQTSGLNLTFPTGSVTVVPYRTYILQVAAETTVGRGPYSTDTTVHTPEDSPTHFPQDLAENNVNSTSFRLQWNPPPPEHHNGEITGYRINITERQTGRMFHYSTPTTQLTVTGLHPHYFYECTVSAITVSEGPYSAALVVQTHEAAPSTPPQNIAVVSVTSTSVALSWSPPDESNQNGLIRRYIVTVVDVSASTLWRHFNTRQGIMIGDLRPFTRYSVSVAARTIQTGPFSSATEVTTLEDLPGAVNNLMLEAINATTLRAAWQEPLQPNGIITNYQLILQDFSSNSVANTLHTTALREFTWYGLSPFYIYGVNITAATSTGRGSFTQRQIRMPEAAPSGPPLGISAAASDSRTLALTWEPPEEEHRNGRIRRYDITVLTQDGYGQMRRYSTQSMRLQVQNLHPYYTYTLVVSAVTIGTGPSANITLQLPEDAPSQAPLNFSATHNTASPTSLDLTWSTLFPEHHNGVIRGYRVTAHPSRGPGDSLDVNVPSGLETFQLSDLSANTLYNISIAAFTIAGPGPSATLQILLLPRVPTSVEVTRVSATEIHVNWVSTNAETYFIQYHPAEMSRLKRSEENEDSIVVVETSQTNYQITGLSPGISYAVSVAAGNEAGRGSFSEETIAELFDSSSFVLHMTGAIKCEPWLVHDADTKQRAMLEDMSPQLMLNYSSSLDLNHIAQTHLSCQMEASDVVILRGTLVGTAERSGAELHQMLQEWVDQGQTFQITGTSLELLTCSTYPESANTCFEIATTPAIVSNSEFQLKGITLYGVIGGGVALLLIVTLCIVVLVMMCRKRQKKRKNFAVMNRMNLSMGMDTLGKVDDLSSASKKELEVYSELDNKEHIYEDPNVLLGTNCGQTSAEPTKHLTHLASKLQPALPTPSKGGASLTEHNSSIDPCYTYVGQPPPQLKKKSPLEYEFPKAKSDPRHAENSDDHLPMSTKTPPTAGKSTASVVYSMPQTSSAAQTPKKPSKTVAAEPYDRPRQKPSAAQAPPEPSTPTTKVNGTYDKPQAKPKKKISTDATIDQPDQPVYFPLKTKSMQEDGTYQKVIHSKPTMSVGDSDEKPVYFPLKTKNMQEDGTYQEVMVTSKSINADGSFQKST